MRKVPRSLYRVKIRLYNVPQANLTTPEGQFQAFYDIDAPLDARGEPDLNWFLTVKEIRNAKADMILEFNNPYSAFEDTGVSYLGDSGIPFADTVITRESKYGAKLVPQRLLGGVNIRELVVGISTRAPVPEAEPKGAYKERLMVLKENQIDYDSGEIENFLIYLPTEADIQKWREESEQSTLF